MGNIGVKYDVEDNRLNYSLADSIAVSSVELNKYEIFCRKSGFHQHKIPVVA